MSRYAQHLQSSSATRTIAASLQYLRPALAKASLEVFPAPLLASLHSLAARLDRLQVRTQGVPNCVKGGISDSRYSLDPKAQLAVLGDLEADVRVHRLPPLVAEARDFDASLRCHMAAEQAELWPRIRRALPDPVLEVRTGSAAATPAGAWRAMLRGIRTAFCPHRLVCRPSKRRCGQRWQGRTHSSCRGCSTRKTCQTRRRTSRASRATGAAFTGSGEGGARVASELHLACRSRPPTPAGWCLRGIG